MVFDYFLINNNNLEELLNLSANNNLKYSKDLFSYIVTDPNILNNLSYIIAYSSGVFGEDIRNKYINLLEYYKNGKNLINDSSIYESYLININILNSIEHIVKFVKENTIKNQNEIEDYISDGFLYLFENNLKQKFKNFNFEDIHNSQITELVGLSSNYFGENISRISLSFLEDYISWLKINIDKNILDLDIDDIDEYITYIKNNKCIFRDNISYNNFMTEITEKFEKDITFNNFIKDFNKICI